MATRTSRFQAIRRQVQRLEQRIVQKQLDSRAFTKYRLVIFFTAVALGAFFNYFLSENAAWFVFLAGMVAFSVVAYFHVQLKQSIKRHEIWRDLKQKQLARMQLDWQHLPETEKAQPDPEHPFELDLDITGRRSLHRLIDTALSKEGSSLLKEWLLKIHPSLADIQRRQAIVCELIPLSHFRNKLYLNFSLASGEQLEGQKLLSWLNKQNMPRALKWLLPLLTFLAVVNVSLFTLNRLDLIGPYYIWTLLAYIFVFLMNHRIVGSILLDAAFLDDELTKLRAILKYLETYPFKNKQALAKICEPFWRADRRPSGYMRKIKLISILTGLRGNPVLALLLNGVCPWDFYCAWLLDKSKRRLAATVPNWLDTFFELEALLSLANFGYLNPDYSFPEITESEKTNDGNIIEATALGHPLIPHDQKVANDFSLQEIGVVALITGSNMAGKSTFLKTIGINLCLTYAGGPVNAKRLKCPVLHIFTCIKINDSITDGFSFFYAEVRRLKRLLTTLENNNDVPIFFLIDEIFKGTNNRERLIGSKAYIRSLANRHGLGAISTHDLELVRLEDEIDKIGNYHFREEVVNGKMAFDFKLRPGPCPTTNALKIMQLEGLPIEGAG